MRNHGKKTQNTDPQLDVAPATDNVTTQASYPNSAGGASGDEDDTDYEQKGPHDFRGVNELELLVDHPMNDRNAQAQCNCRKPNLRPTRQEKEHRAAVPGKKHQRVMKT